MPLVGALVGLPALIAARLHDREFGPLHAVDAFILMFCALTVLFYLPMLPLHAQLTVRYLFVLYPLAIYGLVRLPWVRGAIRTPHGLMAWTYAGGVLIGGQFLLAGLVLIDVGFDEAIQGLAIVGLGAAGLLAIWSLASATDRSWPRVGAVLLGFAASSATNLYLIWILYYFGAHFALPIIPT